MRVHEAVSLGVSGTAVSDTVDSLIQEAKKPYKASVAGSAALFGGLGLLKGAEVGGALGLGYGLAKHTVRRLRGKESKLGRSLLQGVTKGANYGALGGGLLGAGLGGVGQYQVNKAGGALVPPWKRGTGGRRLSTSEAVNSVVSGMSVEEAVDALLEFADPLTSMTLMSGGAAAGFAGGAAFAPAFALPGAAIGATAGLTKHAYRKLRGRPSDLAATLGRAAVTGAGVGMATPIVGGTVLGAMGGLGAASRR